MKRPVVYFILAFLFAGFVYLLERPDILDRGDFSENYLIADYNAVNISEIEILQLINGVRLKNIDGKWMVSEFVTPIKDKLLNNENRPTPETQWIEADKSIVERALGIFGGLEEGVIVSKNPERFDLYNVGESGLKIKATDNKGKQVFDLIIGKNGPDFDSNYIRRNGDNHVRLVDTTLQGFFSIEAMGWKKTDSNEASSTSD